jgi:hypothetical protein
MSEDTARDLAEAFAEVINVFAPIVWPARFGSLPFVGWDHARGVVEDVRLAADRFDGYGGAGFA